MDNSKGTARSGVRWFYLVLAALMAAVMIPAAASAGNSQDVQKINKKNAPLTTNIPYVAWNGERIRLVKCFEYEDGAGPYGSFKDADEDFLLGRFVIENWTGGKHMKPKFLNDLDGVVVPSLEESEYAPDLDHGLICYSVDVSSVKAGALFVKFVLIEPDFDIGHPPNPDTPCRLRTRQVSGARSKMCTSSSQSG